MSSLKSFLAEALNLIRGQNSDENKKNSITFLCLRRLLDSFDSSTLASEVGQQTLSLVNRLSNAASERGCFSVAGIGRRVLISFRDECKKRSVNDDSITSTNTLVTETISSTAILDSSQYTSDLALLFGIDDDNFIQNFINISNSLKWSKSLSQAILDTLGELEDEVENQVSSLSMLTSDLLKPTGETILLFSPSILVLSWLLDAHKKRGKFFNIIICEGDSNDLQGHESATTLSANIPIKSKATIVKPQSTKSGGKGSLTTMIDELSIPGIHTTLISDTAAWACMSRATLVILSTVLASKTLTTTSSSASSAVLCSSGATAIAVAAKAQNVPVIVFASSLSILPVGQEVVHAIANSQSADPKTALGLSLVEANYLGLGSSNRDENSFLPSVVCPLWDALGNDLVDLLVSSSGISTL